MLYYIRLPGAPEVAEGLAEGLLGGWIIIFNLSLPYISLVCFIYLSIC